jgi:putative tryptophan/tyrosine transport system substrate-binding protein
MRRRDFIAGAGAATVWPLAVAAQQSGHMYHIALLNPNPFDPLKNPYLKAFFDELRRNGVAEGPNLVIDKRGMGIADFEPAAAQAVRASPDAILTWGAAAAHAAQQATKTIPIVVYTDDPVEDGLVASMSRPGGNITGIGIFASQLDGKCLEILHELVPAAGRIGVLADPAQELGLGRVESVARDLSLELAIQEARSTEDVVGAIDGLAAQRVAAINILASPVLFVGRRLIFDRAQALRLPTIYFWADMAREGGLIGFGPNLDETFQLLARQLIRVLSGAVPGEIPIIQPSEFGLVINLKTAKALGLTVPPSLLAQADEVIE